MMGSSRCGECGRRLHRLGCPALNRALLGVTAFFGFVTVISAALDVLGDGSRLNTWYYASLTVVFGLSLLISRSRSQRS